MKIHVSQLLAAVVVGGLTLSMVSSAQALSMKDCSTKYKAAQAAGTLNGMKWNDFRKSQCGADAVSTVPATEAVKPAEPSVADRAASTPTTPVVEGAAVFPMAVAEKYAGDKPGKARMQTCLDQYNANKGNNANGGLKWIQKGGGYFSECNKRLKGP